MKFLTYPTVLLSLLTAPAFATVSVQSPANGATVGVAATFVATATATNCSRGVASMGVYVDNSLQYVRTGSSLNTIVTLSPGRHNAVVEEWDNCGGASYTPVALTVASVAGVFVASPINNSTVSSSVNFSATATASTCPQGVASMGVYVNNQMVYTANGSSLNTWLTLGAGVQHTVVQEWDYCGGSTYTPVNVNVSGGGTGNGKVIANIQATGGWKAYGQFAPDYADCVSNCSGVNWSTSQHVGSPSLTGNATRFNTSGSVPYADVLWTNPLIGQFSTQNLPDNDHKLVPTLHNFTYDANVYVTNHSVTQVLEFDINMYMNGVGMLWGTQCNHLGDHNWDIWDNGIGRWVTANIPCNLVNGWNHVTIQAQRQPNNDVLYQSITMNGQTFNINRTSAPFSVSQSWWGVTVNYQMDGDHKQSPNTTYVDNFSLTYR